MIPIQNIYYMLSYAFKALNERGYKNIATEQFDNVGDLCAEILIRGVSAQLKQGLTKEYVEEKGSLSLLRGKIAVSESIKQQTMLHKQMICTYDEFSVNAYRNRILKTTMDVLVRSDIDEKRKKNLRSILVFFKDVSILDIHNINWKLQYDRNNQTYRMLISICNLVINGLLQTQDDGTTKVRDFFDEQHMHDLYENFVRQYYHQKFPELYAGRIDIRWVVDDDMDEMLPIMQTDTTLIDENKMLIIDTKYYESITSKDSRKLNSDNLYQIFAYVKNEDQKLKLEGKSEEVSGMLLYAETNEEYQPKQTYYMSGNRVDVRTLNLNCDFSIIEDQLNWIVNEFFGDEPA